MIYFVSGLVSCGLLQCPDATKPWCGGTELLTGLLSAALRELFLCCVEQMGK